MSRFIDLHIHTAASDGTDPPAAVVAMARSLGLAAIAITDHDTVAALEEAETAGQAAQGDMEVIRGCELSVRTRFGELHLLGLWVPQDTGSLDATLEDMRQKRTVRNARMLERLGHLGLEVPPEAVLREAGGDVIGRPHIARAMVRLGLVPDEQAAFARYLRMGAPAFVARDMLSAAEGVRLLADLGATVSVAHPLLARCPRDELERTLGSLRDQGLDALEAWHAEHSQADEAYLQKLAGRLELGVTGGSDYHGNAKPRVRLGTGRGGLRVGQDVLEALKERRIRKGLPV